MARGFGARESGFPKPNESMRKVQSGVIGVDIQQEFKNINDRNPLFNMVFNDADEKLRGDIVRAIEGAIRDWEKNGEPFDGDNEKEYDAAMEDRQRRIELAVADVVTDSIPDPDAKEGFGAAESGGFERGFGASLSMPSNKIFADLADKMMESPVLGKQGGALAALDAMMDIKYSRNKDLRDYFREAVESKDPYGLGKATITKLSKLDKQTQNEAARLIACVVGAYSSDRAMSEVYRRLSNEGKIDLMKHDSIDKWEKSAEGDRFSEQLQDEANKQISFILKSIAKNGGQGRISIVA